MFPLCTKYSSHFLERLTRARNKYSWVYISHNKLDYSLENKSHSLSFNEYFFFSLPLKLFRTVNRRASLACKYILSNAHTAPYPESFVHVRFHISRQSSLLASISRSYLARNVCVDAAAAAVPDSPLESYGPVLATQHDTTPLLPFSSYTTLTLYAMGYFVPYPLPYTTDTVCHSTHPHSFQSLIRG